MNGFLEQWFRQQPWQRERMAQTYQGIPEGPLTLAEHFNLNPRYQMLMDQWANEENMLKKDIETYKNMERDVGSRMPDSFNQRLWLNEGINLNQRSLQDIWKQGL